MNRSKIEWTDYTWNFITGCEGHGCEVRKRGKCYAMRMAQRLKGRYGYPVKEPFKATFHPDRLDEPLLIKKPSKIFAVSMGDLFGVPKWMTQRGLDVMEKTHWHTFQCLTKQAQNITDFHYPKNVWLGVTVNIQDDVWRIRRLLEINARIKFVSFEPLYEHIKVNLDGVDWVIIGAQTNPNKQPLMWWVDEIFQEAYYKNIPIFLKDNLECKEYFGDLEEFPE